MAGREAHGSHSAGVLRAGAGGDPEAEVVRAKGSENMTNESRKRIGLNIAEQYAESALLFENKYKNHRLADLDRNKAMAVIGVLHAIGLLKQSEYSKKMEEFCQLFDKKEAATVAETP